MLKLSPILWAGALFLASPLHALPLHAQASLSTSVSIPTRPTGPPGLRREAGAWLFNNSIFVAPGVSRGIVGASPFLPNLRRDKKNKLPLFLPAKSGAPLQFSTLPLPTLRQISAPGFDFAALQLQLTAQVGAARAAGQLHAGWTLPTGIVVPPGEQKPLEKAGMTAILKRLRAVLDAAAPESALILQVEASANPDLAAFDVDAAASACDAVILTVRSLESGALWPLKMARRVAEEESDFDLPIFVALDGLAADKIAFEARLLEFWMGGATGFVLGDDQIPSWAGATARNAGLFAGAVTLEDAAVLPSLNPRTADIVNRLRAAGRVPLIGRLPSENRDSNARGETLLAVVDEQTTLETLGALEKAARNGASIYLEGWPDLKNKALIAKIGEMTGTALEVLSATKNEVLTLSDAWLFGEARGREIGVAQRLKWTLKTSLAAQARKKKGEDTLQAFSAAKLASDENGLLVAPLGKGRIFWLAHTPLSDGEGEAAQRDYYAAIAGGLQGGLARLSFASSDESARNGGKIHLTLRASKTGTPIIALFNLTETEIKVALAARSDAPVALDLSSEREIAATVSGFSSNVQVTVPARGFAWLAFGATRAALDKERLAPRPKARTVN